MTPEDADRTVQIEPAARQGAESVVTVLDWAGRPSAGVTVRAIHRPDLPRAEDAAIGITDSLGRVRWTPEKGGVTQIIAHDTEVDVAVAWAHPPETTLAWLVVLVASSVAMLVHAVRRPAAPRPPRSTRPVAMATRK